MAAAKPISVTMPDGTARAFTSLSRACAHFRVPLKRAHKRLTYFGWTPEEALGISLREERLRAVTVTMGDGIPRHFDSLRRASIELGVPYLLAYGRLDRNWTPEQAFGIQPPPKRESPSAKQVVIKVDGKTLRWPSLAQAATANNLTRSAVKDRLRRGWALPQALGLVDSGRPPHKVEVCVEDGSSSKTFESLTAAAEHYRLSVDLVTQRLRKLGWSIEQALGIQPRPGHLDRCYGLIYVVTHTISGRKYVGQTKEPTVHRRWELHVEEAFKNSKKTTRPLVKAIQDFGPDAFTVTQLDEAQSHRELNAKEVLWIAVLGTLLPRGFNATRGGQGLESGKSVVVNGVRFKTITAACEHYGIPLSSASRWLQKGTPEQAFGLEPKPKRRSAKGHPVQFTHGGREYRYPSLRAAAEDLGVQEKKLQRRLKDGWPLPQALGLEKKPGAEQSKPLRLRLDGKTVVYPSHGAAARSHGLNIQTLLGRLRNGWSVKRAITTPPGNQGCRTGRFRG